MGKGPGYKSPIVSRALHLCALADIQITVSSTLIPQSHLHVKLYHKSHIHVRRFSRNYGYSSLVPKVWLIRRFVIPKVHFSKGPLFEGSLIENKIGSFQKYNEPYFIFWLTENFKKVCYSKNITNLISFSD